MTLEVNGIDMTKYIAFGGVQWQRSDVDGEGAGRALSGRMIRDRVAIKIRFDITCKLLTSEQQSIVLTAIEPEYVTVRYTDPVSNTIRTSRFYSNNIPSTYAMKDKYGVEWWSGLTFPLIQE